MLEIITDINSKINGFVWGIPMLALIIITGIYLTVRLGFFQVVHAKEVNRNTFLSIFNKEEKKETGSNSLSQFQALTTALAATVGTGNIVGVTTAVAIGGAGAVFWMWVSAFFGMMTKYSEIVLGLYFRKTKEDGTFEGGTMYTLKEGLKDKKGIGFLAKPLGLLFAIFCMFASFGIGNMSQVNSVSDGLRSSFGVPVVITGIVVAILSGLVIIGGIKRIGKVCESLVPAMSVFYIICALVIVIINAKNIPYAFGVIFSNAFSLKAVMGATVGTVLKMAATWGFKRGVFSNEAGLGSSVMAHVNSSTTEPAKQGMWGIFEVFMDTIIICTLTALVILTSSFTMKANLPFMSFDQMVKDATYEEKIAICVDYEGQIEKEGSLSLIYSSPVTVEGVKDTPSFTSFTRIYRYYNDEKTGAFVLEMVQGASLMNICFENCLGSWSGKLLSIAIVLFAFSTVIGWSCYGIASCEYLFKSKLSTNIFKVIFVIATFVGSVLKIGLVWDISDTLNGLMAIPNLIGLLVLCPLVVKITKNYIDRNIKHLDVEPLTSNWK